MISEQIGMLSQRFQIDAIISETSLNTVYRAFDTMTRRSVIIKTPKRGMCSAEYHTPFCCAFSSEFDMLQSLKILRTPAPRPVALFHEHHTPYLVMSYIPGFTLDELYFQHKLTTTTVLRAVINVCSTVMVAHDLGYAHQDIKPSNILLRPNQRAVLIDWGSTQPIGQIALHRTYTPGFANTQQMQGLTSAENDMYSLGMTLQALTHMPDAHLMQIISRATTSFNNRYRSITQFRNALMIKLTIDQLSSYISH